MILLKSGATYNYRGGSVYNHFFEVFDNFLFIVKKTSQQGHNFAIRNKVATI